MTDIAHADAIPNETPAEVRDHRESFHAFLKFTTFAVMHVALVLACLALAFFGNASGFAVLLGIGGSIAMAVGFLVAD